MEAHRLPKAGEDVSDNLHTFLHEMTTEWHFVQTTSLAIVTLEGVMIADPGDYIIKGEAGEYYPCKPCIFEKIYEAVE